MRFVIAILGFGIAVAVFMFYTRPAYDKVKALQSEIAQYDQALQRAGELQRLKQALLSRYNAFDPVDIERLSKLLPDHVDNVRLVLDLDNLASRNGLAIQNVVIGSEARSAGSGGQVSANIVGGNSKAYDSLTLKFSTQSSYPGFVRFMEDLETSLRIVDLVALTMVNTSADAAKEPVYRFDITIRTYWLK